MNIQANNEMTRIVQNRIKEKWPQLTDEEIALYKIDSGEFFKNLNKKYSVSRKSAEVLIDEFETVTKIRKVA